MGTVAHVGLTQTQTLLFHPGTAQSPARPWGPELEKPGFQCHRNSQFGPQQDGDGGHHYCRR